MAAMTPGGIGLRIVAVASATVTGTVAATIGAFTSSASGTHTPPAVTGTVAATIGPFVSNASGTHETNWYTAWATAWARQASGGGQAHVAVFGDSVTLGYNGDTPYYVGSWAAQMGRSLAVAAGQSVGTGYINCADKVNLTDEDRFSVSGTWQVDTGGGFYQQLYYTSASGGSLTFGPVVCSSFRIMYANLQTFGGTFTAQVDGGSATTINADTVASPYAIEVATISAGAEGSHTLTLTRTSGNMQIAAVEAIRTPARGVKTSRLARGSQGYVNLVEATNGVRSRYCMQATDPDLVVFAFGLNEAAFNLSTSAMETAATTAVQDMQAKGASVLLQIALPPRAGSGADSRWATIKTVIANVQAATGCGVVDMETEVGDETTYPTYYYDDLHPSPNGHRAVADAMANYLLGFTTYAYPTGTASPTIGAFTSSASGTHTPPTVTGTVAATIAAFIATATGTYGNVAAPPMRGRLRTRAINDGRTTTTEVRVS